MRITIALLSLAALAACSAEQGSPLGTATDAAADETVNLAGAAPGVSVSAAPGVAFDYRYAFRLPSARIAALQEQHAQACERLGLARCRITGARYRVTGDREIEAMLAFRLDPTIARAFGKAGVEAVAAAEGMLIDAEINGSDAGAAIRAAGRSQAELLAELRTLENQFARGGLPAAERARLSSDTQTIREQLRGVRAGRTAQRDALATTPMAFHYGSGELIPGFDTRGPIRAALAQAGANAIGGVSMLIVLLLTLAPWAAFALLGWWALVHARTRWGYLLAPRPAEA